MTLPPVHPAVVHFPVALLIFSVVADLIGSRRGNDSLRAAAFWSLLGAALGATVAVAAGYYDMNRASLGESVHEYVKFHRNVGWVLLAVVVGLLVWRWLIFTRPQMRVGWPYLTAAVLAAGLTLFQGWFGGEMVYAYGATVAPTRQGVMPADEAKHKLEAVGKMFGIGHGGEPGDEHGGEQGDEHKEGESAGQEKSGASGESDGHAH